MPLSPFFSSVSLTGLGSSIFPYPANSLSAAALLSFLLPTLLASLAMFMRHLRDPETQPADAGDRRERINRSPTIKQK